MNVKEILETMQKGLIKIKKSIVYHINDAIINDHTENLFFLIEEGLEDNKKYNNVNEDLLYALCYEYEKGNIHNTFKAVDLLKENYPNLYIDTSYYFLNTCHGMFDKGILLDKCLEKNIAFDVEVISEKENDNGEVVVREMMIFTKPNEKKRVKK